MRRTLSLWFWLLCGLPDPFPRRRTPYKWPLSEHYSVRFVLPHDEFIIDLNGPEPDDGNAPGDFATLNR